MLLQGASKIHGMGRLEAWNICQKLHTEHDLVVDISSHLVRAVRDMIKDSTKFVALSQFHQDEYMDGAKFASRLYYKSMIKKNRKKKFIMRS
jgi:hypothetical protein